MRKRVAVLLLACVLSWLPATVSEGQITGFSQRLDRESRERIAIMYVGGIVVAGVAIGVGLYFGLRSRKQSS